jgi:NAD(P)-dependent dehydrogenase (short-subunit alcohol dehydrogenase family)
MRSHDVRAAVAPLAALLALAPSACLTAQELPTLRDEHVRAISKEISGDAANGHIRHNLRFDRPRGGAEGEHMRMNANEPGDRMVVLVTGSTDGLGREVALRMGAAGAHVLVHGRSRERGLAVVREIEVEGTGRASFHAADLASLAEVRAFAETILRNYDRLDVLVNNAGIWLNDRDRRLSADGYELHFAVNYLAGVQLTRMLLPLLLESAPARIVNVASIAQTPLDFDDVMLERGYSGSRAYGQSKLAQILFTFDLAEELEGTGVRVNAVHPATLMPTTMVRDAGFSARSTVEEGAESVMNLIVSPEVGSGGYFDRMREARAHQQAYDRAARESLARLTRELMGRAP